MIYKCAWSLVSGLILDEPVSDGMEYNLIDRGFDAHGIIDDGHVVYYISAIKQSRDIAVDLTRKYIETYIKKCIEDHNNMLNNARVDWKKCK